MPVSFNQIQTSSLCHHTWLCYINSKPRKQKFSLDHFATSIWALFLSGFDLYSRNHLLYPCRLYLLVFLAWLKFPIQGFHVAPLFILWTPQSLGMAMFMHMY